MKIIKRWWGIKPNYERVELGFTLMVLVVVFLFLSGCKPRMIDETQSDSPDSGLLVICLQDMVSEVPTISKDPMCKEALSHL